MGVKWDGHTWMTAVSSEVGLFKKCRDCGKKIFSVEEEL
jgi:hypothetical protein